MVNGKVANCLDEVLLDEDIGGFVGMFLFDSVDDIKDCNLYQKTFFPKYEIINFPILLIIIFSGHTYSTGD